MNLSDDYVLKSRKSQKIADLPKSTENVAADSGYDSNLIGKRIEWTENAGRTGRHFLCPENKRGVKQPRNKPIPAGDESHRLPLARRKFYRSRRGRSMYRRRGHTVEPFNQWFKWLFELDHRVWHRGLDNNHTQLLAANFAYQLLVRCNHRRGNDNGWIRWILDIL